MKEEIRAFVEKLVDAASFELRVAVEQVGDEPDSVRILLSGPDRSAVLRRGAELLDALEYVTNRAFSKQIAHDARIVFDSGNYRAVREQELRLMAEKAAERVRSSRSAFSFEPMS